MTERRPFREPRPRTPPVVQPVVQPGRRRRPRRAWSAPPPSTSTSWAMLVGCALVLALVVVVAMPRAPLLAMLVGSVGAPVLQLWATYLVALMACRRATREQ